MKQTFKKFFAAVSAITLCAVPMMNNLSANAAGATKTYRIYYDVPENSGIFRISFVLDFNDMEILGYNIGNLGGEVHTGQVQTPNYMEYGGFYQAGGALTSVGTAFTVKLTSQSDFDDCIVNFRTSAEDISLKNMSINPVTTEVVLVGDADGNGKVEVNDAVVINSYISNPSTYHLANLRAADANGDGVITAADATMIQRYLAQLISNF